jgi:peptidoglycan/LPS O-acetylase OafA/YrhL
LHIFSLLLLIALVILFSPAGTYPNAIEDPAAIPTNIFLLQSYHIHKIYTWNIPSWSISSEWAAYLLFPLVALFVSKRKTLSICLLTFLILIAYLSTMYLLPRKNPLYPALPVPHNVNTTYDYGFLRGIAGFVLGMLGYLFYQSPKFKNFFRKDFVTLIVISAVITALHFAINDGFCIMLFTIAVISLACNDGYLHKVCKSRALQYLGLVSYSIYLMQIFLQEPFSKGLRLPGVTGLGRGKLNIAFASGLFYCTIYLCMLVAISSITYNAVENPCRKFVNRKWGNKRFYNVIETDIDGAGLA